MLNRTTGAAELVKVAVTQIGKPYSEQSPQGSDGDGHLWYPGEPWPTFFDCSGLAYTSCRAVGIPLSNMTSEAQWAQHLGGVVPDHDPLLPADLGFFVGAGGPSPGHVGIVESYDTRTGEITLINAADTQLGVIRSSLARFVPGWTVGYTRPCNWLPLPPAPNVDPPTQAELDARNLVALAGPGEAHQAVANGWALYVWSDSETFLPAGRVEPHGTPEYANKNWRTKR
jgi:hypothetical protein